MVRQVQPLRISKTTPASSPDKPTAMSRPLGEISAGSMRRNSPSYNQATRKMNGSVEPQSPSPYNENSSPFSPNAKASPRDFWSSREAMTPSRLDVERTPDRSPSPSIMSAKRRASIEKLQTASRVKNSKIFALESKDVYDPESLPIVERPSANRPLSDQFVKNSFTRFDTMRKENTPLHMYSPQRPKHKHTVSENSVPTLSPSKQAAGLPLPPSPEKDEGSPSPTKSSLARISQFGVASPSSFDPDTGAWSDGEERGATPRAIHRHHKSVTFETDPPIINEYEMQTPEPSVSAASGSRESSYDSDDYYDQDVSFERGSSADREDSFDDDLENLDKTPIVMPGQWSRMSPDEAQNDLAEADDDVFDGTSSAYQRPALGRSESVMSDSRPLPALPGMDGYGRRDSASLAVAAERASNAARNLPPPPRRESLSQDEELDLTRQTSLTLQQRLELMDEVEEEQVRPGSKDSEHTLHGEQDAPNAELPAEDKVGAEVHTDEMHGNHEEGDSVLADLSEFANEPPRISRESILRKVRNTKYDFEDEDEEDDQSELQQSPGRPSYAELARMDPDQPIPSRENSRETSQSYLPTNSRTVLDECEVEIKDEPNEDDSIDMSAIPAMDEQYLEPPQSPARGHNEERESSVLRHDVRSQSEEDESDGSKYSSVEPEMESTMLEHEQSPEADDGKESLQDAMQLLTVQDYSNKSTEQPKKASGDFVGLPTYLSSNDYDFGMKEYITPSPPPSREAETKKLDMDNASALQSSVELKEVLDLPRPAFAEAEPSPPGTPESVIHHESEKDEFEDAQDELDLDQQAEQEAELESEQESEPEPEIPERRATIKTGGKLRARPSGTPADYEAMAQQRRLVSSDFAVPPIPQAYQAEIEDADQASLASEEADGAQAEESVDEQDEQMLDQQHDGQKPAQQDEQKPEKRRESRKMKLNLDIPAVEEEGWGLDEEFDRVIESQKVGYPIPYPPPQFARFPETSNQNEPQEPREQLHIQYGPISPHRPQPRTTGTNSYTQKGYLMRHNTKVVVASNRNFSGDSNETAKSNEPPMSPTSADAPRPTRRTSKNGSRKPSAEQFLKTEPWNGKTRRKSVRNASAQRARNEPAPPLPGQESALGVVSEDHATSYAEEENAEGIERGRLFVKVVGAKQLDLPLPRNDRVHFKLTLDNGLHCVTTAPLPLEKSAPIGQEFELVVHDDLEFQLTLNTKLPPKKAPPPVPVPASPTKSLKSQKQSGFSRFLSSPKKRAERERAEREAQDAEDRRIAAEASRARAAAVPTAWDKLHDLVNASDGSFARSYVNLAAHEQRCFGRPLTVDVPAYNEWALETNPGVVNSVRSKRGAHAGPVRKPPYVIGALELQLLYVPRPKGAADESMPKSMSSAIREISRASEVKEILFEGHLSQQGGDCTHWRRRFFRLVGPRLTAYHEHTHQKRAVINLSKAARLVDDKSTLVADPVKAGRDGGRRRSAFAEEDEGYQYVEEGFRIRFANGETIDFYADDRAGKEGWMEVLAQVVGKADPGAGKAKAWTDVVLAREKALPPTPHQPHQQPAQQGAYKGETPRIDIQPASLRSFDSARDHHAGQGAEYAEQTEVRDFTRPPAPATNGNRPGSAGGPVGRRPGTPPLAPRTGGRSRDAVKSMIF